jgi:metal-dependent amidase/aminoacylase/carboxypeptidase family protein
MLRAGDAFNVIPSEVELRGTIRTFEPAVRQTVLERFHQIVTLTAAAFDCQAEVDVQSITPPVINDAQIAGRVQSVIRTLLPGCDLDTESRTMGSEDMAFMMQEVPGCYFFVGSANAEKGLNAAHHHPKFDFDERVLPRAAALMAASAAEFLS